MTSRAAKARCIDSGSRWSAIRLPAKCPRANDVRDRRSTTHSPAWMRRRISTGSTGSGADRSTSVGPARLMGALWA